MRARYWWLMLAFLCLAASGAEAADQATRQEWVLPFTGPEPWNLVAQGRTAYVIEPTAPEAWRLVSVSTGDPHPRVLYVGKGTVLGLSVSPQGTQMLVSTFGKPSKSLPEQHLTNVPTAQTIWLDLQGKRPVVRGQYLDESMENNVWSDDGSSWVSRSGGVLVLHQSPTCSLRLAPIPPQSTPPIHSFLINEWCAEGPDSAYALLRNGHVYRCDKTRTDLVLDAGAALMTSAKAKRGAVLFGLHSLDLVRLDPTHRKLESKSLASLADRLLGPGDDIKGLYGLCRA